MPSGAGASSSTRPSSPAAVPAQRLRVLGPLVQRGDADPRPRPRRRRPTPRESAPSGRASRARTPGTASSVRAGPSRWVSRCTVPRTCTMLERPVRSGAAERSSVAVSDPERGSRAVRGPPSRTSSRRGSASGSSDAQDPQLSGRLVDHPLAVGAGVPGVERGRPGCAVVGVPAQAGAVGGQRVDVAPALVVGEEGDPPLASRTRRASASRQLPVQVGGDPDELAGAVGVPPQPSGGAAAVALPPGHVPGHRAAERRPSGRRPRAPDRRPGRGQGGAAGHRRPGWRTPRSAAVRPARPRSARAPRPPVSSRRCSARGSAQ